MFTCAERKDQANPICLSLRNYGYDYTATKISSQMARRAVTASIH